MSGLGPQLQDPGWLALVLPLGLLWGVLHARDPRGRWLRAALIGVALVALARPFVAAPGGGASVHLLVDASKSVGRAAGSRRAASHRSSQVGRPSARSR